MKKNYALLASLLLMLLATLTSCEKFALDDSSKTSSHDANANVFILVQQIQDHQFNIQGSKTSEGDDDESPKLTNICNHITYAIFDGEEKIANVNQDLKSDHFGQASLNLDEGEYRLVVIAHNGEGNCSVSTPQKVKFSNNKLTDTFYYYGHLSVTSNGAEAKVNLLRAVAKIHFTIEAENIPENAHSIKFYYTGGSSTLDATTGFGCVNSRQTEIFKINSNSKFFDVFTFPHEESEGINMTVSLLDSDAKVIKSFSKEGIQVKCNYITTTTLNLSDGESTDVNNEGGFIFTFDPTWDGEIPIDFE